MTRKSLEAEFQKSLKDLYFQAQMAITPNIAHSISPQEALDSAKTALLKTVNRYVKQRELLARVDELTRLKFTVDNTRKDMEQPKDMTSDMAIKVRLLQLKALRQQVNGGES